MVIPPHHHGEGDEEVHDADENEDRPGDEEEVQGEVRVVTRRAVVCSRDSDRRRIVLWSVQ